MAQKDYKLFTVLNAAIEEDIRNLEQMGKALSTLANTQEKFDKKTMEVTTEQLRLWGLLCSHVALWVPENLYGTIEELYQAPDGPKLDPATKENLSLDPATKENLSKDVMKMATIAGELQTMAELICCDFGLSLPDSIKEKITRERAARKAAAQPDPA
jgi:hypothetical protein